MGDCLQTGRQSAVRPGSGGQTPPWVQMDQISASRTKAIQLGIPSFTDTARRTVDPLKHQNQF